MSTPFMGEIRIMAFNFAPTGWTQCNGQLLPINQNQPLFALLGTTFGGNGNTNFALPNLRGRTPIHAGSGHTWGQTGGEQAHTLTLVEMPTHFHTVQGTSLPADSATGVGNLLATATSNIYGDAVALVPLAASSINTGGSQPHLNMQPYLVLNFCIALQGIFPSQT